MKALIDADWFAYAHGGAKDDEGHPLSWPLVASRISQQIDNITKASGADSYVLYLTGKNNFRETIATIKPYKGTRPSDKPYHYQRVRDFLIKFRNAFVVEGMEADDKVSIEHCKDTDNTILCSLDKDFDMVPGNHYNWTKDEVYHIDELTGLKNFYRQLLTGDNVDNIPGLYGVGKSSKLLSDINSFTSELDMYGLVQEQYEKRFGSYWKLFLIENATLLWMLRTEDDAEEAKKRLECLEEQRQINIEAS